MDRWIETPIVGGLGWRIETAIFGADRRSVVSGSESADERVIGTDEAGKGPVVGPMVAAAVLAAPARLPAVADSKRLTAARRAELAEELREGAGVRAGVAVVPTAVIDDPTTDMNGVTVAAQAAAVRELLARSGSTPSATDDAGRSLVADAGDTDEARFGRRLREAITQPASAPVTDPRIETYPFGNDSSDGEPAGGGITSGETTGDERPDAALEVTAAHGADDDYPIVSAASIVAKLERDRLVEAIDGRYDRPVGSGYPSDGTTRAFLREFVREQGRLPECARESWATAQDVLDAASQSALDEF